MKTVSLAIVGAIVSFNALSASAGPRDLTFGNDCGRAEDSAVISFNGDILVHHSLYEYIMPKKTFSPLWIKTKGLLDKADFSVGNLEGPTALGIDASGRDKGDVGWIYDARYYGDGVKRNDQYDSQVVYSGTNMVFNFHPQILKDLKNTGYDLLTLANNHALDRRSIGIDRTLQAAQRVGIPTSGVRMTSETDDADFYHIANINNVRVAFISCTEETNGRREDKKSRDKDERYYQVLRCMDNSNKVSTMIANVAKSVDAVIVLPHWGIEYSETENAKQRSYAQQWIKAGALGVVGSHPHVLQPWEKYVAKTNDGSVAREGVIMYSLGNFVASQKAEPRKTGMVTYIGLNKTRYGTSISAVGYTPTYRNGYEAMPVNKMTGEISRIVIPKFGTENFVGPQQRLGREFCR